VQIHFLIISFIGNYPLLFWLRFDTALECQCEEELKADNKSIHTTPKLMTLWPMEKQCGMTYTHEVFQKFQSQELAARDC
jgi:hypothetical protein